MATYILVCTGEYAEEFHFLDFYHNLEDAISGLKAYVGHKRMRIQEPPFEDNVFTKIFPDTVRYWIDKKNLDFESGYAIIQKATCGE